MPGRSVDDFSAPLFIAWQLTNRCQARCISCCEESGPDKAWRDELTRDEALRLAHAIVEAGVPYAAFGGGEPLGVPFCWEIFEVLAEGGVRLKLETDASLIDDAAADRLAALGFDCIQISLDGATAQTHERMRPGSSFDKALAAMERLVARGFPPQWVFVPGKANLHEIVAAYDRAAKVGASAFVTGPMMRIGRAAQRWDEIACSEAEWESAARKLRERANLTKPGPVLAIYPWDIVTEMETRLESPQAMLLIVPNGKVKLLNALPFAPADLRRQTLHEAWDAYRAAWRTPEVRAFVTKCRSDAGLLRHANETWAAHTQPLNRG
ncbi:MAG: radical SAM protein [Usitatibacter sp.]